MLENEDQNAKREKREEKQREKESFWDEIPPG